MSGIDKPTRRVAIVLALLVTTVLALRGYLPGARPAPQRAPTDPTLSLVAIVALTAVALSVLAFAVLTRRTSAPSSAEYRSTALRGVGGELRAKWVLIALGLLLGWLVVIVVISRLGVRTGEQPAAKPSPVSPPSGTDRPEPIDADNPLLPYLIATTVILLLILVVGAIAQAKRGKPRFRVDAGDELPRRTGPQTLLRAAELGLAEIGDVSREPRAAIIACYAAMERGLAHAPGAVPLESDTPSEVLARAVDHHAVFTSGATELVQLFIEARFSPHVMTEVHRDSAVAALQDVLADLRGVS
jgi:Domain of unknown function (DUF4129)